MTVTTERTRRSPAGVLGDVLLWIAAIGGVICILVVLAAVVFHVTLIMFKTGSMAPTIPTGSLAVVHEIPASQIDVGDVVTVDREGQLPVTHRVTSVAGVGDSRTITLRGDANAADDVSPYVVTRVREVWVSVPGWASVVVWFSNPVVLGALTVSATALVTWAFWPRDERHGRRRASRRHRLPGSAAASITSGATVLLALGVVVAGTPQAAHAAEVETVVHGAFLTLTSISDPVLTTSMTTGVSVPWQVGVDAVPTDPGSVDLGVAAVAPLPDPGDFTLRVQACPVRWVAGVCTGIATEWLPPTDLVTAVAPTTTFGAHRLGGMDAAAQVWLLMSVTRTTASQPQPAQLQLWAWGLGQPLSVGGQTSGGLAFTGGRDAFPPALLAAIAVSAGLLLAGAARVRRRREVDDE
jgi:signal peptidase